MHNTKTQRRPSLAGAELNSWNQMATCPESTAVLPYEDRARRVNEQHAGPLPRAQMQSRTYCEGQQQRPCANPQRGRNQEENRPQSFDGSQRAQMHIRRLDGHQSALYEKRGRQGDVKNAEGTPQGQRRVVHKNRQIGKLEAARFRKAREANPAQPSAAEPPASLCIRVNSVPAPANSRHASTPPR